MFGLLAAGIAGVYGHMKSRSFVGRRLRYTDLVEKPALGLWTGVGATLLAAPVVAVLPVVGAGTAIAVGIGVGTRRRIGRAGREGSAQAHRLTRRDGRQQVLRISGFSFVSNAVTLDYPVRESLASLLPVVDELVVVVAQGESDDGTRAAVESLGDSRLRIIDAEWDLTRGALAYSDLTNLALEACTGDWCLYLQADEVLHEDDLPGLRARCEALHLDRRVQGMLFEYLHFFGDYGHVQRGQGWYPREVRLVRNRAEIRSVRDAQSFRLVSGRRLTVAHSGARVFHYGWARHPEVMQMKTRTFWSHRVTPDEVDAMCGPHENFDYGPMRRLSSWSGSHPSSMRERIAAMD